MKTLNRISKNCRIITKCAIYTYRNVTKKRMRERVRGKFEVIFTEILPKLITGTSWWISDHMEERINESNVRNLKINQVEEDLL